MAKPSISPLRPSPDEVPTPPHTIQPDSSVDQVKDWLDKGVKDPSLKFKKVTQEEFVNLETELLAQGIHLRYDWDSKTQDLVLSMPQKLHEAITQWLVVVLPVLSEAVRGYARDQETICVEPTLELHGTADCSISISPGHTITKQPDQGITVYNNKTQRLVDQGWPTIIFEVCNSQNICDTIHKGWLYLWHTGFCTQAVVIYDLSYPPSENFQSKIGIWIRSSTSVDELLPLDACGLDRQEESHTSISKAEDLDQSGGEYTEQDVQSEHGEHNKAMTRYIFLGQVIELRHGWVEVCNEADPNRPLNELWFSHLDILRLCRLKQEVDSLYKTFPVELEELRRATFVRLHAQRDAQREVAKAYQGENSENNGQGLKRAREDNTPKPIARKLPRMDKNENHPLKIVGSSQRC